ncbi:hypothetical protein D9758_012478 [Tetrapyrgos nigripes]|uniref:Uncharacterized protein n=1 Tax=Tetrapyrgos nigripes TaxID=182062 RepID=A0A8H5FUM6_9AGAR|nr:hypothetical protein D9758_012478 [Tetrapyrgos nigripes]
MTTLTGKLFSTFCSQRPPVLLLVPPATVSLRPIPEKMFAKLSLFAAIVLPLVHALTIDAPTDAVSTQPGTITFSGDGNDSIFTIELDHPSLLSKIAVANNVNPGEGSVNVIWPTLLETTGYTLEAVNVGNISDIFATSPTFNIAPQPSSASASGSRTSVSLSATNPPGGSASATAPASPRPSAPSGTTNSASGTSGSQTQSGSGSTQSSPAPSQINGNGAFAVQSNLGAVVLVAIGAAVFAL